MNTTLVNAVPVEVTHLDGSKETVELRQLSIRQLYRFIELATQDATPEIVALCVGQPSPWIDTLSDESYTDLAQQCHEQNFPRAMRLSAKDPLIAIRVAPLAVRFQQAQAMLPQLGTASPAPSPVPVSLGSAAAAGSAAST